MVHPRQRIWIIPSWGFRDLQKSALETILHFGESTLAHRLLTYLTMSTQTKGKYVKGLAILAALALTAMAGCANSEEQTEEGAGAVGEGEGSSSGSTAQGNRAPRGPEDGIPRASLQTLGERFPTAAAELSNYPVGDGPGRANWGPIWGDWTDLNPSFTTLTGSHWGKMRVKVLEVRQVREGAQEGSRQRLRDQVIFYRDDLAGTRIGSCPRNDDGTLACAPPAPAQ
jgi:hypothetical protein